MIPDLFVYYLTLTDEGCGHVPRYEVNSSIVVVAANAQHARKLASEVAIDEPADTWTNGRYSRCQRIGVVPATGAPRTPRVVCAENNAS